jgi:hypothetical protein
MSVPLSGTAKLPLVERLSDRLNPIFIKETRQALKSRQFLASFFLMLIASWLVATFGLLLGGADAESSRTGPALFAWFFNILCVATYIVVPFGAFRSLLAERDQFTYEVLAISTLSPRQIVWGKLQSALLQTFIYYSAITPFIAFTYQLRGIGVLEIVFLLAFAMLASVGLSLLCLSISTFARQRAVQILATLAVIVGLLIVFGMNIGMTFAIREGTPFDLWEFWITCGMVLGYYAAYMWLMLEVAVSQLTFEADNRSTAIRLGFGVVFWMSAAWVGVMVYAGYPGSDQHDLLSGFFFTMLIHWLVLGLFAVTETDELSRRTLRALRRWGLFRLLLAPLMPGGARGLLFVLMHVAATTLIAVGAESLLPPHAGYSTVPPFPGPLACLAATLYVAMYLGFACALSRWLRVVSPDLRPAHARVFTILIVAVVAVIPKVLLLFDPDRMFQPYLMLGDPLSACFHIWYSPHDVDDHLLMVLLLGMGAVVAVGVNLRAMLTGVAEVALARVAIPEVELEPAESATG